MSFLQRDQTKVIRRYIETMERQTVIVHTTAGTSIQGALAHVYDDCIVLEAAVYLSAAAPTKVDGEVVIERGKVVWLQRIGPSSLEEV